MKQSANSKMFPHTFSSTLYILLSSLIFEKKIYSFINLSRLKWVVVKMKKYTRKIPGWKVKILKIFPARVKGRPGNLKWVVWPYSGKSATLFENTALKGISIKNIYSNNKICSILNVYNKQWNLISILFFYIHIVMKKL